MEAKKITCILDIIQYIERKTNENQQNMTISKLEERMGVSRGNISRWKKHEKQDSSFEKILRILKVLNVLFVIKDENDIEQINSQEELIGFICEKLEAKRISKSKIEHDTEISSGMIGRWKNHSNRHKIRIGVAIRILTYLECEVFFIDEEWYEDFQQIIIPRTIEQEDDAYWEDFIEKLQKDVETTEEAYFKNLYDFIVGNTTQSEKKLLIKMLIDAYFGNLYGFIVNNTSREEKATLVKRLIDEIIE